MTKQGSNNHEIHCSDLIRPGHWKSLDYMDTQQFREVLCVFNGCPEIGGVYCRPTASGVRVVDLCSRSRKPRVGVGAVIPALAKTFRLSDRLCSGLGGPKPHALPADASGTPPHAYPDHPALPPGRREEGGGGLTSRMPRCTSPKYARCLKAAHDAEALEDTDPTPRPRLRP